MLGLSARPSTTNNLTSRSAVTLTAKCCGQLQGLHASLRPILPLPPPSAVPLPHSLPCPPLSSPCLTGDNILFTSYAHFASPSALWSLGEKKAVKEFLEYVSDKGITAVTRKMWKVPEPKW